MRYDKGPLGALMDEYERAANEYIRGIGAVAPESYDLILNPDSEDPVSCKGITSHVIGAGYGYANGIRIAFGMTLDVPEQYYPDPSEWPSQPEIPLAVQAMLDYTIQTLDGHWSMTDDEINEKLIPMRWKERYDLESLLEHAIVHILRHRRQIERLTSPSR